MKSNTINPKADDTGPAFTSTPVSSTSVSASGSSSHHPFSSAAPFGSHSLSSATIARRGAGLERYVARAPNQPPVVNRGEGVPHSITRDAMGTL